MNKKKSSEWTHFLNTYLRKERVTSAFPSRTPLFHLECNLQAKSMDV